MSKLSYLKSLITGMVRVETSKAPSASFTAAQAIARAREQL